MSVHATLMLSAAYDIALCLFVCLLIRILLNLFKMLDWCLKQSIYDIWASYWTHSMGP